MSKFDAVQEVGALMDLRMTGLDEGNRAIQDEVCQLNKEELNTTAKEFSRNEKVQVIRNGKDDVIGLKFPSITLAIPSDYGDPPKPPGNTPPTTPGYDYKKLPDLFIGTSTCKPKL